MLYARQLRRSDRAPVVRVIIIILSATWMPRAVGVRMRTRMCRAIFIAKAMRDAIVQACQVKRQRGCAELSASADVRTSGADGRVTRHVQMREARTRADACCDQAAAHTSDHARPHTHPLAGHPSSRARGRAPRAQRAGGCSRAARGALR